MCEPHVAGLHEPGAPASDGGPPELLDELDPLPEPLELLEAPLLEAPLPEPLLEDPPDEELEPELPAPAPELLLPPDCESGTVASELAASSPPP